MPTTKKVYKENHFNDIALKLLHKLYGVKYLHYGYFSDGLSKTIESLPQAQEKYVEKVLEAFPKEGIKKVLDIGCGVGEIANRLLDMGYDVTCVDPSPFMIKSTLERTQNRIKYKNDFYENVTELPLPQYDLILMSESAQYIDMDSGWRNHAKFLRPGGLVVAADFFKIREIDRDYLSKSGHRLDQMIQFAERNGFKVLKQINISSEVAPTMDIYQKIINDQLLPILESIVEVVRRSLPKLFRILAFFLRSKVNHILTKYQHQDSGTFLRYKQYYILVFQKVGTDFGQA